MAKVPHQVIHWPIEVIEKDSTGIWQVGECGQTDTGIFCLSALAAVLETWKWEGATLTNDLAMQLPGPRQLVFLPGGKYLGCMSFGKTGRKGPLVLGGLAPGTLLNQKDQITGWIYGSVGSSRNARFVAVCLEEDRWNPPPDFDRQRLRVRVGLLDLPTLEIRWIGQLPSDEGILRKTVVSDDGEYIAVTGCNNKIALLSASLGKVLWHQKPEDDAVYYAVFSSDGLTLYCGGISACVYTVGTTTGKVTGRWHATRTGRPIYGHRIACMAISPDDRWVAAGTGTEGEVYLFDVTGKEKPRMLLHGLETVNIVSFSPDSKYLASVAGGKIKIWAITPGTVSTQVAAPPVGSERDVSGSD